MGRTSKKRKLVADKVRKSRSAKPVKGPSAFDLRVNKQKHNILGRNNNARGQVGNPVQSRTRAFEQRSKTLLKEFKYWKKSNVFKDNRLGETTDRLAMERKNDYQKLDMGEEGEEEELTHMGQAVSQIEKFEDLVDSDSDDEDGRLGGRVTDEHFGGFMTEKKLDEKTSWKDRMAELISQTRKEKYNRQSEKDDLQKQIEAMDAEFKNIHEIMITKRGTGASKEKPKPDAYDIQVRMQQFEIRGTPSDRLKSEAELAREEAERLKKLEDDRKRRMKGELASLEAPTHISADSLEDGFSSSYTPITSTQGPSESATADSSDSKMSDDKDGSDDDNEGGDDDNEGDNNDGSSSGDGDEEDSDDSDLCDDDDDEEEMQKAVQELLKKKMAEEGKGMPKSILKKPQVPAVDPEERKKIAEAAKKEMPYTFTAPENMTDLVLLLRPYSPSDQVTVVERLVACHHPSLAEGNKQKLQRLFAFLLQYLLDMMSEHDHPPPSLLDSLTPILHQLMRHDQDGSAKVVTQLVLNRHEEFQQVCQRHSGRGRYLGLDTMLLLKLIQVLYPTSDFQHPVVTPAFHLMTAMLGQTPVQTEKDVATGLYLCSVCAEYVSLSKRYVPEVINFLHGVLFLAAVKKAKTVEKVFPPFRPVGKFIDLLKVTKKVQNVPSMSLAKTLVFGHEPSDDFRVWSVSVCVSLLQELCDLWNPLPAATQIFTPILHMLPKLPSQLYPQGLQERVDRLKHSLEKDAGRPLECLTTQKEKPQPLKQIEPRIEEVFDGRKKRKGTREQLERQRLQHKVKKEFKGALREIRKDSQFLASTKMQEIQKKDVDRQNKLKRIYSDLQNQEGEVRALKRKKDHP